MLQTLLHHLAAGEAWDTAIGSPVTEKTVTAATQPLTDAGWEHTVNGRWIRWTNPSRDAGIRFDAFTAHQPNSSLTTWTVTASPYTPSSLLADISETLAHDTDTRHAQPTIRTRKTSLAVSPPATAPVTAGAAASR